MTDIEFSSIYHIEYVISNLIRKNIGYYCHFSYDPLYSGGTNVSLKLILFNPRDNKYFLYHKITGDNKFLALKKLYNNLKSINKFKCFN